MVFIRCLASSFCMGTFPTFGFGLCRTVRAEGYGGGGGGGGLGGLGGGGFDFPI
jgi:hypothetical protein